MTTLVVKNLPETLHDRLRQSAQRNHRSVTKEAMVILERGLTERPVRQPIDLPPLIKLSSGPVTTEWIEAAINQNRE